MTKVNDESSSDSDSDFDFEIENEILLDDVADNVPTSTDQEDSKKLKRQFHKPQFAITEGSGYTDATLSCDLLLVAGTVAATAFLHHTFSITEDTQTISTVSYNLKGSKTTSYINVYSVCNNNNSSKIFIATANTAIPTNYAGPISTILEANIAAKMISIFSTLPLATYTHSDYIVLNTSRNVVDAETNTTTKKFQTRPNPIIVNKVEKNPPLLYCIQSSQLKTTLYNQITTVECGNTASITYINCNQILQDALYSQSPSLSPLTLLQPGTISETMIKSLNYTIPFLPPPNQLFGFEAAILAVAESKNIPSIVYVSIDDFHNYTGETLVPFEYGLAHVASLLPSLTSTIVNIIQNNCKNPSHALYQSKTLLRARVYRAIRDVYEKNALLSLKYRDIGQHKLMNFAGKPIPSGLFA